MNLADFGLALPTRDSVGKVLRQTAWIIALVAPGVYIASANPEIRAFYPYYMGAPRSLEFALFEGTTLMFYLALECMFRGYILFGIKHWISELSPVNVGTARLRVTGAAVVFATLPYACWHLGKPAVEIWGTIIWGLVAGAAALSTGT